MSFQTAISGINAAQTELDVIGNNIANAQGHKLVAFNADATGNILGTTAPLQISQADIQPQPTTAVTVGLNLDAQATVPTNVGTFSPTDPLSFNESTSTTIFDSLGSTHLATFYYAKTAANTWQTRLYVDGTAIGGAQALGFDTAGAITTPAAPSTLASGAIALTNGAATINMTLSYGTTTQFGSQFGVNELSTDGFASGRLAGLDIDDTGKIFARFTNGETRVEGQVALANFANPQGLQSIGESAWVETIDSGAILIGAPGTSSLGLVQSGSLEESNIDLAAQLVRMIVVQRNYQANAEVISANDATTQAIINI